MKFLLPFLAFGFLFLASCEKKEATLLNELAGTYNITGIVLIPETGADTTIAADFTITFSACDLSTSQLGSNCELRVNGPTDFSLEYGVLKGVGSNDPTLNINPGNSDQAAQATIAYQLLQSIFTFQLNENELIMTSNASGNLPHRINGQAYIIKQITARRS